MPFLIFYAFSINNYNKIIKLSLNYKVIKQPLYTHVILQTQTFTSLNAKLFIALKFTSTKLKFVHVKVYRIVLTNQKKTLSL